jgi:class 3 adenylate cyclase
MAETRKLAALFAADVAGYSRLAGADEERTLARHSPKVSVDILKPRVEAAQKSTGTLLDTHEGRS